MNCSKKLAFLALATCVSALTVSSASAQNPGFQPGDLFLGFQTQASTNYVVVGLGDLGAYRNATSNIYNITNVSSVLTSQFGNYAENTNLLMGAAGVYSSDPDEGDITLTISAPRTSPLGAEGVQQGFGYLLNSSAALTAAQRINSVNSIFEAQGTSSTAVIAKSGNFTGTFIDYDDQNPVGAGNVQGIAYGTFSGGVQTLFTSGNIGSFGGISGIEAALDLYTIDPSGLTSTFEGSLVVDGSGNVSFIVAPIPEPSTALGLGLLVGMVGFIKRRRTEVVA